MAGPDDADLSLGDYLHRHGYSKAFIYDHLLPMAAAIWSSSIAIPGLQTPSLRRVTAVAAVVPTAISTQVLDIRSTGLERQLHPFAIGGVPNRQI